MQDFYEAFFLSGQYRHHCHLRASGSVLSAGYHLWGFSRFPRVDVGHLWISTRLWKARRYVNWLRQIAPRCVCVDGVFIHKCVAPIIVQMTVILLSRFSHLTSKWLIFQWLYTEFITLSNQFNQQVGRERERRGKRPDWSLICGITLTTCK